MVHHGREEIAEGDRQQEDRHDERLHASWRLGVRELQRDDRHENLRSGEDYIGEDLPENRGCLAGVDALLDPGDQGKGAGHQEEARADFSERGELDPAFHRRVEQESEDGDEDQDQEGVCGLDLRGQKGKAQNLAIHVLSLEDPGRSGLVKEGPEHRHKQEEDGEFGQRFEALGAQGFADEVPSAGRNVDELPSTQPECPGRDRHEDPRDPEGEMRTVVRQGPGNQNVRDRRTQVDREVKHVEDRGQKMGVARAELVSHVGRDAGLDSARSQRNEGQTRDQPEGRDAFQADQGKAGVTEAVDQGEPDDGAVFSKECVADDGTEEGSGVDRHHEKVLVFVGGGFRHGIGWLVAHEVEEPRHEDDERCFHSVKAETLRRLVRDDVRNARWHGSQLRIGGGAVFRHGRIEF